MSKWVGYAVSINCCEPLGCYQGTIKEANTTTITLTNAFRNGFPYPKPQVTLSAVDILDLKIIDIPVEPTEQTHSTVEVTKSNKKGHRATVCENLQAMPSASGTLPLGNSSGNNKIVQPSTTAGSSNNRGSNGRSQGPAKTKPIEIQAQRNKNNNQNNHAGSYGNNFNLPFSASTPRNRGYERARRRNEACFGDDAELEFNDDFDFEGNLALFDKQALWNEIRNSYKPDVVRQTDEAGKLRHDENVLGAPVPSRRIIHVPEEARGPVEFVTDDGVVVPSVSPRLRRQLWAGMQGYGLLESADTLLARAVADISMRLVGGGRRLDPRNAHQAPTAVALVGPHRGGSRGIRALRQLTANGVHASAFVAGSPEEVLQCTPLQRELSAYRLTGYEVVNSVRQLPNADLVLLALYDLQLDDPQDQYMEALEWVRAARAVVIAVEPPAAGWEGVAARASVAALLPPALPASLGHLFLANVAPPAKLMDDLRIDYRPPFSAAFAISLCATGE